MYGLAAHKGYGTAKHVAAISQHGPVAIHRRTFAPLKSRADLLPPTAAELARVEEIASSAASASSPASYTPQK